MTTVMYIIWKFLIFFWFLLLWEKLALADQFNKKKLLESCKTKDRGHILETNVSQINIVFKTIT